MRLGVCYYPEHWPQSEWRNDARRMADIGLSLVRIGEFSWSHIEPSPGQFEWGWMDEAIETLANEKLSVIVGTPTATPPKWLIDRSPDILAVDRHDRARGFGSRRHYCFSSPVYRAESQRITRAFAERYGHNEAVTHWQTDNEYGCHNTALSYSDSALQRFREWLTVRYGSVQALNEAWGNVFWSMEYRDFSEVDLPTGAVTELNPSHSLDFRRFSSDMIAEFNREQVDIIRELSPGRAVTHNFMGYFTDFDHHTVGADLDIATWDAYPLGFLDMSPRPKDEKRRWLRTGHPDLMAFHHDLYHGCAPQWGIMEQQPGPVNWAPHNPAPNPGIVRLWTYEAFGHGAAFVNYFRWRQAPFAQEQMHAGLLRPDSEEAPAAGEARTCAEELAQIETHQRGRSDVALIFDYDDKWFLDVQPQGREYNGLNVAMEAYSGLRKLGLDVDVVSSRADLSDYKLIVAPSLVSPGENLIERLSKLDATLLLWPRAGSKTTSYQIPKALPPGPLQDLLPLKVTRVESLPPACPVEITTSSGVKASAKLWFEEIEADLVPLATDERGHGAWYQSGNIHYLATWPEEDFLREILLTLTSALNIETFDLPTDVRLSRRGDLRIALNFSDAESPATAAGGPPDPAHYVLGGPTLGPAGIAIWKTA